MTKNDIYGLNFHLYSDEYNMTVLKRFVRKRAVDIMQESSDKPAEDENSDHTAELEIYTRNETATECLSWDSEDYLPTANATNIAAPTEQNTF